MLYPFDNRPHEFRAHVVVLASLIVQYIPFFRLFASSIHKVWIVLYFIGYHTEGIRASQAASGAFYLLMSICAFCLEDPFCLARLITSFLAAAAWA